MRNLTLLLLLAALQFPPAHALEPKRQQESFHYNYPLSPGGTLSVDNFNGSVEISGWDQNSVDIAGKKFAESADLLKGLRIDVAASDSAIQIRTIGPDTARHGNLGVQYVIKVPRRVDLKSVSSSNGGIKVGDVEGAVSLRTSNGPIQTHKIRGDVDIKTTNGSVSTDQIAGALEASTSNGPIHASLEDPSPSRPLKLSTSNGPVDLRVASLRNNDIRVATSNGPITLHMPPAVNARLRATTSNHSSISNDLGSEVKGEVTRHHVDGTIGSGGPLLELTTTNGPIKLSKQ